MGQDQTEAIMWRDGGVPVATRFDDPYFSLENGLEETRHVFLAGNDLPRRFRPGFHIAELGFGTGLNMLAALMSWRAAGNHTRLAFTSFEAFPLPVDDMARALSVFPEMQEMAAPFLTAWGQGQRIIKTDTLYVEVILGDARETLPRWGGHADAWFLDGFSPAKNPEMWGSDLMRAVADHTAPGGTCATYTAAGFVRRGLDAAGFDVARKPGYGRKRHMVTGVLRGTS